MAASGPRPHSLRRNAVANVGGRSVSALLWLLMTPFVLSHLGAERFAVWSLFFALGGYVANFDLGMTYGVSRYVAVGVAGGEFGMVRGVIRRSVLVGGALGVAWCLAFLLLREAFLSGFKIPPSFAGEAHVALAVFAASVLVYSLTQVLHGALMGFQRLDLSNGFTMAGLAVHMALLALGLSRGLGLIAAAAAMTAGHVVSGTLAWLALRGQLHRLPPGGAGAAVPWRELMRVGGLVQATGVLATGWQHAGKIVLGTMGRLVWVTTFELGYRVALAVLSVPQLILGAVIPAAARASAAGGHAELRTVYAWSSRWIFALAGMVLSGLWLLAPSLIMLWVGPGHAESAAVARTAAVMFACLILCGPATAVARGAGFPGLETIAFGIAFGLDVAFSLLLAPRFGPQGAVWAMALSIIVAGAWIVTVVHRRFGIATLPWLRGAAVRIAVPGAVAVALSLAGLSPAPAGRADALRHLLLAGATFTALSALVTWPSGDVRTLFATLKSRLAPPPLADVSSGDRA